MIALVPDQTRLYIPTRLDIVCASASLATRLSSAGQLSAHDHTYASSVTTSQAGDIATAAATSASTASAEVKPDQPAASPEPRGDFVRRAASRRT